MAKPRSSRRALGMTGDDVKLAVAALGLPVEAIAAAFGVHVRTVWTWQADGAPAHVAIALEKWLAGELTGKDIKPFLRRIGRTRDDGNRYG